MAFLYSKRSNERMLIVMQMIIITITRKIVPLYEPHSLPWHLFPFDCARVQGEQFQGGAFDQFPTKWACNPLFADEILRHGQICLVLESQYFPWGGGVVNPSSPNISYGPACAQGNLIAAAPNTTPLKSVKYENMASKWLALTTHICYVSNIRSKFAT